MRSMDVCTFVSRNSTVNQFVGPGLPYWNLRTLDNFDRSHRQARLSRLPEASCDVVYIHTHTTTLFRR